MCATACLGVFQSLCWHEGRSLVFVGVPFLVNFALTRKRKLCGTNIRGVVGVGGGKGQCDLHLGSSLFFLGLEVRFLGHVGSRRRFEVLALGRLSLQPVVTGGRVSKTRAVTDFVPPNDSESSEGCFCRHSSYLGPFWGFLRLVGYRICAASVASQLWFVRGSQKSSVFAP